MLIFVLWIFFTLGVVGVFVMRKRRPELKGEYKVPLYPIVPIIGIAGSSYIIISTIVSSPINSLVGIGLTVIGLPVYFWCKKKNVTHQEQAEDVEDAQMQTAQAEQTQAE